MPPLVASLRKTFPVSRPLRLVVLAGALAACADSGTPTAVIDSPDPLGPSGEPGLAPLMGASLASGMRLEVEFVVEGEGWRAREVEVQTEADLGAPERIESQIVAADATAGRVTLRLGGIGVAVAAGARFERAGGESLSRDEFFAELDALLAAGASPGVELRRRAVHPAQAPGSGSFLAQEIRLEPGSEDQVLDLNVDGRHLASDDGQSGTLTLLGVAASVDAGSGSSISERSAAQAGAVDVEGLAASVDEAAGTVTLDDGTVVRILPGTRVKSGGKKRFGSLAELASALAEGVVVEVDADAVLESEGVYVAVKVAFERVRTADDGEEEGEPEDEEEEGEGETEDDGDEEEEGDAEETQFGGRVVSVDLEEGTFLLVNGRLLTLGEETAFDEEGDLFTIEAMAGALDAGDVVMAEGRAAEDEDGAWIVSEVRVETSGEDGGFGGRVFAVDLEAGTFTLPSGKVMTVGEETVFDEEGDLESLEAMAGALDAGDVVTVEGLAEKDGETGQWIVVELRVNVAGDDDDDEEDGGFGGRVASVDLEGGTFELMNGRVYGVGEETVFDEEGDLVSLEAMAGALEAGDVVTVEGLAERDEETGARVVTQLHVETNGEDGPFEGRVAAVDTEAGTFTLKNRRTYTVDGDTAFDEDGDHTSLESMAEALADGRVVIVEGIAEQDAETGAWKVAEVSVKQAGKP